jgi:hypothetical protein
MKEEKGRLRKKKERNIGREEVREGGKEEVREGGRWERGGEEGKNRETDIRSSRELENLMT